MNKASKEIWIVILLLIAFIAVTVLTSSDKALGNPDSTVFSAGTKGASLLYDTLEYMGYPVAIDIRYITAENTNYNDIQIIINPFPNYTSQKTMDDIANWVVRGGNLIYFVDEDDEYIDYFTGIISVDGYEQTPYGNLFHYGMGRVFIAESFYILNDMLMTDGDSFGQPIADMLDYMGYGKIYFNESVHGYAADEGFFSSLPFELRLLAYQIVIVTVAIVLYLGKRFGKPVIYQEEAEREENEYVFTLSNLYMSTGMGSSPINAYHDKLTDTARRFFRLGAEPTLTEIMEEWQKQGLPDFDKLQHISTINPDEINTKQRQYRRELTKTIGYYKDVIKILSKL